VRLAIRVRKGVPADARIPLDRRITIGRDPSCDLVLVDSRVSRHHAEIVPDGAKPRFRDTASTNGTRLNGVAAVAGELAVGDVLRVGDSELAVEADA
jgi:pSer/pThr/pTyr-binding forkhead associated (FHA) protein